MKRIISILMIVSVANLTVFQSALAAGFSIFESSGNASLQSSSESSLQSSSESSSQSSTESSSDQTSEASTQSSSEYSTQGSSQNSEQSAITVLVICAVGAAIGLMAWGISTTTAVPQNQSPQVEVSVLIDEAARMNGNNIDILSKVYGLDKITVSDVIMKGYLDHAVSADSLLSAESSLKYIHESLHKKSAEVNGKKQTPISKIMENPKMAKLLLDAYKQNKAPGEILNMVFSF